MHREGAGAPRLLQLFPDLFATVDQYFDLIDKWKAENPAIMEVEYHRAYGYPTRIHVDYDTPLSEDKFMIELSNLRPLEKQRRGWF